jgi:DNA-binding IclR family transcriptional regulator
MEFSDFDSSDPSPALTRGLLLLQTLGAQGPLSLEKLAKQSGWPKSSVFRLLSSLESFGAVERDATDRRYRAALRLVPFAPVAEDVRARALNVMRDLGQRAGHTVELFAFNEGQLTMIDRCEPDDREVAVRARIGWRPDPAEAFALTIAPLAWAPEEAAPFKPSYWMWKMIERLTLNAGAVRKLVESVRADGIAVCSYANGHGVRRYAVPIRNISGNLWGVLAIAAVPAPVQGVEHERLKRLALSAAELLNRFAAVQTAS